MNELSPLVFRNYAIFVTYLHNPHNQSEPLLCAKDKCLRISERSVRITLCFYKEHGV